MGERRDLITDPVRALDAIETEVQKSIYIDDQHAEIISIAAGLAVDSALLFYAPPGLGKTKLATTVATVVGGTFGRAQGTPDLMSSDITGSEVVDLVTREPKFRKGPIFNNVFLVDDWNRAGQREMAALVQAMAEQEVTVGNDTHDLPENQLVIATQNSQSFKEGTRPTPTAVLDRFAASIEFPRLEEGEWTTIRNKKLYVPKQRVDISVIGPKIRERAGDIYLPESMSDRAEDIILDIREHKDVEAEDTFLDGYRPFDQMVRFAQARALKRGKERVSAADLHVVGRFILRHRVVVDPEYLEKKGTFDAIYDGIVESLPPIDEDAE